MAKNNLATPLDSVRVLRPMRYRLLYFLLSLAVIIPGLYSLKMSGLRLGIDFTGGSEILWQSSSVSEDYLRETAELEGIDLRSISSSGDRWSLSTEPLTSEKYRSFLQRANSGEYQLTELSFDTIGPSLGDELVRKTIYAITLSTLLILLYIAYRFRNLRFGFSAVLAMLHDSLIVIGLFSILGHYYGVEIDTLFVTALLTILSFSVHDTIVVFDRVRELSKKHSYLEFEEVVNRAVVETLGRSLNNSMTIIFMLLAMYLLGGETTKWFIFALLIGTIAGTYSSTFTAAPILVTWHNLANRK